MKSRGMLGCPRGAVKMTPEPAKPLSSLEKQLRKEALPRVRVLSKIAALCTCPGPQRFVAGLFQLFVPDSAPLIYKGFLYCEQAN